MFDFSRICKQFEGMSAVERGAILASASVKVLTKLSLLDIHGIDAVNTLATFIIGSVVADGNLDEREYLFIYPSLVRVFGEDFDYASVKRDIQSDRKGRAKMKQYSQDMATVLGYLDESLQQDVVLLCLAIVSVDGKVSFKEKRYLRQLMK